MVEITKPYQRATRKPFGHYGRKIVVTLEPIDKDTDAITMHLKGTRTKYRAPVDDIFRQLAQWHGAAEARRRREAKKLRRMTEV